MPPRAQYRVAASLARAELVARPRRYARLFIVLAAVTACLFLILSLLSGVSTALGRELQDTLVSDFRMGSGDLDFGEGDPIHDSRDILEGLNWEFRDTSARFAPRYEVQVLVEHGGNVERWRAAFLVGIDPALDREATRLESHLVSGQFVTAPVTRNFITYYPVVISREFMDSVNVTIWDGVSPITDANIINGTAGHELSSGAPLKARLVPVGVYVTGIKLTDARTFFAPIEAARALVGHDPRASSATVILGSTDDPDRAVEWARARGFNASTGRAFTESELAPVFGTLRVFTGTTAAILIVAAVAWVAHVMSALIFEDRSIIAALRAIGLPARAVSVTYILVGSGVGFAGGVAGLVLGGVLVLGLNAVPWRISALEDLRLSLSVDVSTAIGLLALATIVSTGAILIAFRPTVRESIASAVRHA